MLIPRGLAPDGLGCGILVAWGCREGRRFKLRVYGAPMTRPAGDSAQWTLVDEGWGRKATDFAALSEPSNCREYVYLHHRLRVDAGTSFQRAAVELARGQLRDGLPLRAALNVVGYLARKPEGA